MMCYRRNVRRVDVVLLVREFAGKNPGSRLHRRDGTDGEALRWYAHEVLVCEGDRIGKT